MINKKVIVRKTVTLVSLYIKITINKQTKKTEI